MTATALRFTGGRLALPDGPAVGDLVLRDGRVASVAAASTSAADESVVGVEGLLVAPGFVDMQVNGGHGIDLTSELGDHPERLRALARHLPAQGVTAFVPTIVSAPREAVTAALRALRAAPGDHLGAVPLGVHAEGPMLAPAKRGTHDPGQLRAPDPALIEGWSREAGVIMATLAPELPGALDLIAELVARGTVVSIGHSDATYEQARAGLDAGARAGTHLGNAMSGFSAREPGVIGALLADPTAVVGL
ncbi:MAG TPA: amidohydrolase family protein, partial [Egicoccus sp.]